MTVTPAMAKPAAPIDEVDDEIIEIFMEEADEEYANISRLLPQWINNQQDEDALKDMRRSFHPLKGSGRLVGATDVGEFAWAYENMLNRLIDQTITTSPTMFEVLQRGMQTLPELFDLFRSGGKPGQKILTLMEHAEAISQGKDVVLEELAPHESISRTVQVSFKRSRTQAKASPGAPMRSPLWAATSGSSTKWRRLSVTR